MALHSRSRQGALLSGCFLLLLLLGHVSPGHLDDKSEKSDNCLLPKKVGFCKASFPRWYYDRNRKICKTFIWGGCGGNGNNFESVKECEQACPVIKSTESCLLPSDVGFCKAIIPRWYYDQYEKACKEFDWGGCGGNDNNFESEEECEQFCSMDNRRSKLQNLFKFIKSSYWIPH